MNWISGPNHINSETQPADRSEPPMRYPTVRTYAKGTKLPWPIRGWYLKPVKERMPITFAELEAERRQRSRLRRIIRSVLPPR